MEKSLKNYSQGLFSFPPRWCFLLASSLSKDLHSLVCMAFLLYIHFKSIFHLNMSLAVVQLLCVTRNPFFPPAQLGYLSAELKLQDGKLRLDIRKNLFDGSECRSTEIGHPRKWWRWGGFKEWIQQRCVGDFLSLSCFALGQEDGPDDPSRTLPALCFCYFFHFSRVWVYLNVSGYVNA